MVLHNPNNWHWVNKNVMPWAKNWLETELIGLQAEEEGVAAKIDSITTLEGDVEVSQRKGKVITIYDIRLQLEYSGNVKDGSSAVGAINIPEIMHDTEEDEYVFEVDIKSDLPKDQAIKTLCRNKLVPQIRERLPQLTQALITEHGKDIQHKPGEGPSSGFEKSRVVSSSRITKSNPAELEGSSTQTSSGASVNTTSLSDEVEYRTSAAELYQTFTDPQRLAAFTRSPPKVFEGAKPNGKFELFGGNVSGYFTVLEEPTRIVQKWRLAQWPAGHYSTLELEFEQNDEDHVTKMKVNWQGVPKGQQDVTLQNWREYYVRSIKLTFGFGTFL